MTVEPNSKFLTVGSGPHYMPGWCNLDLYANDADIKADMFDMPFKDSIFTRVYVGHVAEHIDYNQLPALLKEIHRVAEDGAEVIFVGPDIDKAVLTSQPQWLLEAIVRNEGPTPGTGHMWSSSEYMMLQMLNGQLDLNYEPYPIALTLRPDWANPSDAPWQYCIRGFVRK
jgi:predicted SAM-dependent methyltransferase